MKNLIKITLLITTCYYSPTSFADLSGKVINVIDGDTIDLLVASQPIRIRLVNIDAPELGQPFGRKSKDMLSELVYFKEVQVKTDGLDKYGRMLGDMYLNNKSVNKIMVERGLAWAYRKYLSDPTYLDVENNAEDAHIGLWQDESPVSPWQWRNKKN